MTMGRPGYEESTAGDDATSGDAGIEQDAGLVGYVQEGDDGTGLLMASQHEDDVHTKDVNPNDAEKR
jgi:hypothetical protein